MLQNFKKGFAVLLLAALASCEARHELSDQGRQEHSCVRRIQFAGDPNDPSAGVPYMNFLADIVLKFDDPRNPALIDQCTTVVYLERCDRGLTEIKNTITSNFGEGFWDDIELREISEDEYRRLVSGASDNPTSCGSPLQLERIE